MNSSVPGVTEETQIFLKAIASETRQRIMLLFAGAEHLSVGEIAQGADLGASTASEHLTVLRRAGLLRSTRDGKTVRYRVDDARIAQELDELGQYLSRCCPPPTGTPNQKL